MEEENPILGVSSELRVIISNRSENNKDDEQFVCDLFAKIGLTTPHLLAGVADKSEIREEARSWMGKTKQQIGTEKLLSKLGLIVAVHNAARSREKGL